jgi:hypothetical protein
MKWSNVSDTDKYFGRENKNKREENVVNKSFKIDPRLIHKLSWEHQKTNQTGD